MHQQGQQRASGTGQQHATALPHDILLSPHRIFFVLAGLWAVLALAWFQWGYAVGLPCPSLGTPTLWHAHEMTVGFGGACMAAFFLTALPNWTGGQRPTGAALAGLAVLWLAARAVLIGAEGLPLWLVLGPGLAFYTGFTAIFARAVRGRWDRAFLPLAIAFLGLADAAFVASSLGALAWPDPAAATRVLVLFFTIKVSVIAGGMTPAFTANHLRQSDNARAPRLRPWADRLGLALLLAALVATLAGWAQASAALLIAAGLAQLARMVGWRSWAVRGYAPAAMLHLAFAWLPLGLVLTGAATLVPLPWRAADTIHVMMMGAMAGLALSIASRAAARRAGTVLHLGPVLLLAYGAIWAAVLARMAAPVWLGAYTGLLSLAAGLWCIGWAAFVLGYGPALRGPVPRPVFNAGPAGHGHGPGRAMGGAAPWS
ncbi:NnrS family protein [Rhodovulum adriaticum]|uniref:Uncharacterized protein involved in response to NO n=1 Tax=Rhodovulum adriaticum TaxID=35804 RepID=A0A4R2NML0_RHOAD|nr:NnrS family protein [Rhodovulum adriaticum]MBK1636361.1 hypothetical protein [Rhodovulum adriaticum]TCP22850.1 uncharacterized protein involved in response to NO [Rhodovulum adriaticum]